MRLGELLAMTLLVLSAPPAPDAGVGGEPPAGLREAHGRVEEIDRANQRLKLVRSNEEPLVLQLDKATTVFIDGQASRLEELGKGQEVRASFEWKQGAAKAQWIEAAKRAKKAGN